MVDYVDPVLVVDDLNTMTRIVDGMLRKCGFSNVEQVHDGPTALQKLPFNLTTLKDVITQLMRPPQ